MFDLRVLGVILAVLALGPSVVCGENSELTQISGIYPRLAVTNLGNSECGIGAVVPWAERLWFVTYPASGPRGSDDKLYAFDEHLERTVSSLSIGGTHANRMIHRESAQLIIGPYFIDAKGDVRAISPQQLQGRLTATTRHLSDPANKVYFVTMEEGLYEVDVHTLSVKTLHPDLDARVARVSHLPGDHGKGGYVGQGRLVVSNNAGGGVLAEWTGTGDPGNPESWNTVDRNKYTDVTGPGGIYGAADCDAPLWAIGWDAESLLLNVCDGGSWARFRLPKASFTHDADNGCFTEWPRIREAGGKRMMTMHGMFFDFPTTFSRSNTAGIRPIGTFLKMVVDFVDWNGALVCAANDASKFDNPLSGRPQSNLWFTSENGLRELGPPAAYGGAWRKAQVLANKPSEPFWLGGAGSFSYRAVHLAQDGDATTTFMLQIDERGDGRWSDHVSVTVPPGGYACHLIPPGQTGEWVRVKCDRDVKSATVWFHYGSPGRRAEPEMFTSLASAQVPGDRSEGILLPGDDPEELNLAFAASVVDSQEKVTETGYYTIGGDLKLRRVDKPEAENLLRQKAEPKQEFQVDEASIILVEKTTRYRLPKGPESLCKASASGWRRVIREVVTERSLINVGGTFYELPRSGSGGLAKIRPITTHDRQIFDFASWRGLLVLSGNLLSAAPDEHYVCSDDGKVGLWLGNVDDLWKLGPPRGEGGPWKNTVVKAGQTSDPYLMTGYDRKSIQLTQDGQPEVRMTIEVDVTGENIWHTYRIVAVPAGKTVEYTFPRGYSAHWVRIRADRDCRATAWFIYGET